ncbi:MAG: hypothetical protein M1814_003835 [Vezdaea aestivalis]|nr:MAG: hypothetical protein M1814_003835 [Vezdaea aestivalis]
MDVDRLQRHRIKRSCEAFVASINPHHICELASFHSAGRACRIFAPPDSGSYKVCFFVTFAAADRDAESGQRWVVRFPMPSVHDPVGKLKSEIATMRYIKEKTTIPIPSVHGYGFGRGIDINGGEDHAGNPTGLPFIILDYVDGERLRPLEIPKLPEEKSQRFYDQLVAILTQLRRQEFPCIGSLTLDSHQGSWIIGNPQLIDLNDQHTYNLSPSRIINRTFGSTIEYVFALYQLLYNSFHKQRNSVYDEEDAREKVYALEQFKGILWGWIKEECNYGPFVLMHGDLRPSNILIDSDYNILAIIDWEWSRIVPVQLFLPPTWLTGCDADIVARPRRNVGYTLEYTKLYSAILRLERAKEAGHESLRSIWPDDFSIGPDLFIASAMQRFNDFEGIFWNNLLPHFFPSPTDSIPEQFFQPSGREQLLTLIEKKLTELSNYQADLEAAGLSEPETIDITFHEKNAKKLEQVLQDAKKALAKAAKRRASLGLPDPDEIQPIQTLSTNEPLIPTENKAAEPSDERKDIESSSLSMPQPAQISSTESLITTIKKNSTNGLD